MNLPDDAASRIGVALLVVGYPTSVAVLVRIMPVLRQRRGRWFGALVAGLTGLTAGWALLRRPAPAAVNLVGLVAVVVAWVWTGRRRR